MNTKDLHNIISLGEGFTVEFKEAGTSKIGRELCAFANATGGVEDNWVTVIFQRNQARSGSDEASITGQVTGQVTEEIRKLVLVCTDKLSRSELQELLRLKHRDNFTGNYLNPAIEEGFIEMTIPDKPKSSKQKYRLTQKGKALSQQQNS